MHLIGAVAELLLILSERQMPAFGSACLRRMWILLHCDFIEELLGIHLQRVLEQRNYSLRVQSPSQQEVSRGSSVREAIRGAAIRRDMSADCRRCQLEAESNVAVTGREKGDVA